MLPNQKRIKKQQTWKFFLESQGYTIWYLKLLEIVCQRWELWWCWWSLPSKAFQDNSQVQLFLSLPVNFGYNLFKAPSKLTKLCWVFLPTTFFFLHLKSFNSLSRRLWRAFFPSNSLLTEKRARALHKSEEKNTKTTNQKPWKMFWIFSHCKLQLCHLGRFCSVLPGVGPNGLTHEGISIPLKQVNSNLDQCFELSLTSKSNTIVLTHLHVLNSKLKWKKDLCLFCTGMILKNVSSQKNSLVLLHGQWPVTCSQLRHWYVMPASPADCASDPA